MLDEPTPPKSDGLGRTLRRWGPRAAFEMALIVFSIMLALGVSAWIQDQQMQTRVREARGFLIQEITENRSRLVSDHYLPHHRRLRDGLATINWNQPLRLTQGGPVTAVFQTGVHPAELRDAVWRSVSNGELIEHMPQQDVFALYDAYRAQEVLEQTNRAYYPVLARLPQDLLAGDDIRAPAMSLQLYLSDVVASEEGIVQRYDAALAALRD